MQQNVHPFVDFIVRQKMTRSKVADRRHRTAPRGAIAGLIAGLGLTSNSRHDRANEDMSEDTREERGPMTDLRYEAPATLQAAVALLAGAAGAAARGTCGH